MYHYLLIYIPFHDSTLSLMLFWILAYVLSYRVCQAAQTVQEQQCHNQQREQKHHQQQQVEDLRSQMEIQKAKQELQQREYAQSQHRTVTNTHATQNQGFTNLPPVR